MRELKPFLSAALAFFATYLMGAFFSVSFDISTWSEGARFFTVCMGGGFGIMVYGIATA